MQACGHPVACVFNSVRVARGPCTQGTTYTTSISLKTIFRSHLFFATTTCSVLFILNFNENVLVCYAENKKPTHYARIAQTRHHIRDQTTGVRLWYDIRDWPSCNTSVMCYLHPNTSAQCHQAISPLPASRSLLPFVHQTLAHLTFGHRHNSEILKKIKPALWNSQRGGGYLVRVLKSRFVLLSGIGVRKW
jgi:hypothetical protein